MEMCSGTLFAAPEPSNQIGLVVERVARRGHLVGSYAGSEREIGKAI